jgi:hypothetical protein
LHGKYLDEINKKDEQQTRKWGKYFKLKKHFTILVYKYPKREK